MRLFDRFLDGEVVELKDGSYRRKEGIQKQVDGEWTDIQMSLEEFLEKLPEEKSLTLEIDDEGIST